MLATNALRPQISDDVSAILSNRHTNAHGRAWHKACRILQPEIEVLLVPDEAACGERGAIVETGDAGDAAPDNAAVCGPDAISVDRVTCAAPTLIEPGAACRVANQRRDTRSSGALCACRRRGQK